ncbi:hypothetical protein IF2G_00680 [Cordyceps javanica]|nr:hypothetical protein IF2G_00680 [Cordyceps javanica]
MNKAPNQLTTGHSNDLSTTPLAQGGCVKGGTTRRQGVGYHTSFFQGWCTADISRFWVALSTVVLLTIHASPSSKDALTRGALDAFTRTVMHEDPSCGLVWAAACRPCLLIVFIFDAYTSSETSCRYQSGNKAQGAGER